MKDRISIITIGLSPTWDITCRGRNIDWGLHQEIDEQTIRPAGKALNVSKALAWMGQRNIAAGLWGHGDHPQMLAAVRASWPSIRIKLTAVAGRTRQNITVIDSVNNKEMHLRSKSLLVSAMTLKKLQADLEKIVHKGSICVLAGTMPDGGLLGDIVRIVEFCKNRRAKIALDTSGRPLKQIVDTEIVLISRGAKGGVVVTKEGAWQGRCAGREKVFSTVSCGDFLLAGFLKALEDGSGTELALKTAIKVATARAWGWTESKTSSQALREIKVAVEPV